MSNTMTLLPGYVLRGRNREYNILKVLGQGTFGITYLAQTQMVLEEALGGLEVTVQVAVKEFFMREVNGREGSSVTTGSNGPLYAEYKRKFLAEAQHLSQLHHPGIVRVLEAFNQNDTAYYVMEYLPGGSLDARIGTKGLSEEDAVRYARQIGKALQFMHEQKMLHLDLKPGNIMLNKKGEAVLIDFGLSKQYDAQGDPESSTSIGAGTPGYAPLEQANYQDGKHFPVTIDVYALGGTLFKMLTGQRPPAASEIFNYGFPVEEMKQHGVSQWLIDIVQIAMKPAIIERYQSVTAMLADLSRGSGDEKTTSEAEPEVKVEVVKSAGRTGSNQIERNSDQQPKGRKSYKWVVIVAVLMAFAGVAAVVISGRSGKSGASGGETKDSVKTVQEQPKEMPKPRKVTDEPYRNVNGELLYLWTGLLDEDGVPTGKGVATYAADDKEGRKQYEGTISKGMRQDSDATLTYTNGDVFRGKFQNDVPTEGRLTWKEDNSYFDGTFRNDQPYTGTSYTSKGQKAYVYKNGEVTHVYLDGKLIPYE